MVREITTQRQTVTDSGSIVKEMLLAGVATTTVKYFLNLPLPISNLVLVSFPENQAPEIRTQ